MIAETRFETGPSTGEGAGGRYRTALIAVVAAVAGTAFGIGLTIVSVLVPRRAELSRMPSRQSAIGSISMVNAMKAIAPDRTWLGQAENQPVNYGFGPGRPPAKTFQGTMKVPAGDQQSLVTQLLSRLLGEVQAGGKVSVYGVDTKNYATGVGRLNFFTTYDFMSPRGGGTIQVHAIGRGDDLTIVVSISEY